MADKEDSLTLYHLKIQTRPPTSTTFVLWCRPPCRCISKNTRWRPTKQNFKQKQRKNKWPNGEPPPHSTARPKQNNNDQEPRPLATRRNARLTMPKPGRLGERAANLWAPPQQKLEPPLHRPLSLSLSTHILPVCVCVCVRDWRRVGHLHTHTPRICSRHTDR